MTRLGGEPWDDAARNVDVLARLNPGVDTWYRFVRRRVAEEVWRSAEADDRPAHSFALGTVRTVEAVWHDLIEDPRRAPEAVNYLRRTAQAHQHHPDFPLR